MNNWNKIVYTPYIHFSSTLIYENLNKDLLFEFSTDVIKKWIKKCIIALNITVSFGSHGADGSGKTTTLNRFCNLENFCSLLSDLMILFILFYCLFYWSFVLKKTLFHEVSIVVVFIIKLWIHYIHGYNQLFHIYVILL